MYQCLFIYRLHTEKAWESRGKWKGMASGAAVSCGDYALREILTASMIKLRAKRLINGYAQHPRTNV